MAGEWCAVATYQGDRCVLHMALEHKGHIIPKES